MSRNAPPLILHVFPNFNVGGPQVRFAALANHFGRAYRHAIIAMNGNLDCAKRLSPELDVTYPAISIRRDAPLANMRQFRHILRELRPDVLVTGNWGSIEWAMANLLPLVRHIHIEDGFGPEEQSTQIRRRILMRRAVLRRSTVVLPSRTLWRIATESWQLPESRLRYVPNGIDLARFARVPRRGLPGEGPVIGTVAALRPEKNIPRLLRAFHILSRSQKARLVIVGDGPERPRLEAITAELGLRGQVLFTGHVEDPSSLLGEFDLFALSSDTEQMPISVLEAMAARLPVVATDVGDVRDMLCQENAPFIVPKDESLLAERLLRLLADRALGSRIGQANRDRAEQSYSEQAMFRTYRDLFDGAV